MRWHWTVLGSSILAAAAAVSCARLFRPNGLEAPEPTGTLRMARMHEAEREDKQLGAACGVGDWDDDGKTDYAIGVPGAGDRPRVRGEVRIQSGASGDILLRLSAPEGSSGFGKSMLLLPDVDGDGRRDLAIGAPGDSTPLSGENPRLGLVEIRSGRSGDVLRTFRADPDSFQFGSALGSLEDANGPHRAILLVGASEDSRGGAETGSISGFSCADGALLYRLDGAEGRWLGSQIASCGDLDADGCPDFTASDGQGVLLLSGRTGAVLRSLTGKYQAQALPSDDSFDLDLDGCPDVVVGEQVLTTMYSDGRLVVYSGRDGHPLWMERFFAHDGALVTAVPGSGTSLLAVAGSRTLSFFSLPEMTLVSVLALQSGWFPSVRAVGDVDGDGMADLLLAGHGPRDWVGLVFSKDLPRVFPER